MVTQPATYLVSEYYLYIRTYYIQRASYIANFLPLLEFLLEGTKICVCYWQYCSSVENLRTILAGISLNL